MVVMRQRKQRTGRHKMRRHINKALQKAIAMHKPLRWEYGRYNQYYTGLKLIAYSGYAETTGKIYESVVFATGSIKGASDLCRELVMMGATYSDWERASDEYQRYHSRATRPIGRPTRYERYLKNRNPSPAATE